MIGAGRQTGSRVRRYRWDVTWGCAAKGGIVTLRHVLLCTLERNVKGLKLSGRTRAPNRGRQCACPVCSAGAAVGAALGSRSAPSTESGAGNALPYGWHVNGTRVSEGLKEKGGEGSGTWRQRAALRMHPDGRLASVPGAPCAAALLLQRRVYCDSVGSACT